MLKRNAFILLFFGFLSGISTRAADVSLQGIKMKPAVQWLQQEAITAETLLLQNISPTHTVRGTVIASPQTENPNYFRHWTRDAALTMDVVFQLSQSASSRKQKKSLEHRMKEYALLSRQNQLSAGLGEPIFEVNGHVFLGPWGRPQNDGPALRAIVLVKWAERLLDQGETDFVKNVLYDSVLPTNSVIKKDLEYVASHWTQPCFDLWEEVNADHFYTKMVQRKALRVGAQLARRLNDAHAADWYERQAYLLEKSILEHISPDHHWILASLNWAGGMNSKTSNLDIAVILGVLHGQDGNLFQVQDLRVQKTFFKLNEVFQQIYQVNQNGPQMGPALGRYPEDIYAGTHFNGGNPWVLATLGAAEYSYRLARAVAAQDKQLAQKWISTGDDYIRRIQYHANPDGSLSEQIDRHTGYMTSARDLTWNYAAVLTTHWARQSSTQVLKSLKNNKSKENK